MRILTGVHRAGHRVLHGRIGSRYPGRAELVFVTVTGRRTGKVYPVPLLATRDGADEDAPWVVAGSAGGQADEPQWSRNLRAQARAGAPAALDAHGSVVPVRVECVTDDAEHDRLYQLLNDAWPFFARYAARTTRRIPVFRLHQACAPTRQPGA